jgi:hypothetical protein
MQRGVPYNLCSSVAEISIRTWYEAGYAGVLRPSIPTLAIHPLCPYASSAGGTWGCVSEPRFFDEVEKTINPTRMGWHAPACVFCPFARGNLQWREPHDPNVPLPEPGITYAV